MHGLATTQWIIQVVVNFLWLVLFILGKLHQLSASFTLVVTGSVCITVFMPHPKSCENISRNSHPLLDQAKVQILLLKQSCHISLCWHCDRAIGETSYSTQITKAQIQQLDETPERTCENQVLTKSQMLSNSWFLFSLKNRQDSFPCLCFLL